MFWIGFGAMIMRAQGLIVYARKSVTTEGCDFLNATITSMMTNATTTPIPDEQPLSSPFLFPSVPVFEITSWLLCQCENRFNFSKYRSHGDKWLVLKFYKASSCEELYRVFTSLIKSSTLQNCKLNLLIENFINVFDRKEFDYWMNKVNVVFYRWVGGIAGLWMNLWPCTDCPTSGIHSADSFWSSSLD